MSGFPEERRVTVAGATGPIPVAEAGRGPPVLLLPGLARTPGDLAECAATLVDAGWRCLAPWPRALAESTPLSAFAADARAVLEALAPGTPPVVLGVTFGGRVARRMAAGPADATPLRALIVVGAGGDVPPDAAATADARAVMAAVMAGEAVPPEAAAVYFSPRTDLSEGSLFERFTAGWRPDVLPAQRAAARDFAGADGPLPPDLPALIVQGADDRLAPPENGRRLAAAWGPNARLVTVPDCGHMAPLERPGAVGSTVRAFLERHAA